MHDRCHGRREAQGRLCGWPDCEEPGEFRAPGVQPSGIDGEGRIAAYVINLTKHWRSDWGGLLQFHSASRDIPLGLKPGFNTVHLFRVPQVNSVSYVAPFARVPHYAITGWLRR